MVTFYPHYISYVFYETVGCFPKASIDLLKNNSDKNTMSDATN